MRIDGRRRARRHRAGRSFAAPLGRVSLAAAARSEASTASSTLSCDAKAARHCVRCTSVPGRSCSMVQSEARVARHIQVELRRIAQARSLAPYAAGAQRLTPRSMVETITPSAKSPPAAARACARPASGTLYSTAHARIRGRSRLRFGKRRRIANALSLRLFSQIPQSIPLASAAASPVYARARKARGSLRPCRCCWVRVG